MAAGLQLRLHPTSWLCHRGRASPPRPAAVATRQHGPAATQAAAAAALWPAAAAAVHRCSLGASPPAMLPKPRSRPRQPPLCRRAAPSCAVVAMSSVAVAAASAPGGLAAVLNSPVLGATVGAAFKLLLLCGLVGGMVRNGTLPPETSRVLSQVSYYVVVPSMLFTKVSHTLATRPPDLALLVIPLAAAAQVALGMLAGRWAARLAGVGGGGGGGGGLVASSSGSGAVGGGGTLARLRERGGMAIGWHPRNPARSADAIARSAAAASGVPRAAGALQRAPQRPDDGGNPELVAVACGFCNSLTLPMVFIASLLTGPAADATLGYTALVQIAWYPLLWSWGYRELTRQNRHKPGRTRTSLGGRGDASARARLALINRAGARLPGKAEGGRPPGITARGEAGRRVVAALVLAQHYMGKVMNPPLLGVVSGVLLGISPLGRVLHGPGGVPGLIAATSAMPPEVRALASIAACAVEMFAILGGATLAVQGIVLGTSLFEQQDPSEQPGGEDTPSARSRSSSPFNERDGARGGQPGPPGSSSGGGGATATGQGSGKRGSLPARLPPPLAPPVSSPSEMALEEAQSPAVLDALLGRMQRRSSSSSSPSTTLPPASSTYSLPPASAPAPASSPRDGYGSGSTGGGTGGSGIGGQGGAGPGQGPGPGSSDQRQQQQQGGRAAAAAGAVARAWAALPLSRWLRALLPSNEAEARMLVAVAGVRFLVTPLIAAGLVQALRAARLLPPDPLCAFALLLQGVMPSAQTLTVLVQLSPSTRPLAPLTARLLLRLYALAVLPVTLWVSLFASWLQLPLLG